MISPRIRWYIKKIVPFGVIWMLFGALFSIIERGLLGKSEFYPASDNPYDFTYSILLNVPGAFFLGIIIGMLEVFYFENKLHKLAVWIKLLVKTVIYITLIFVFLLSLSLIANSARSDLPVFHPQILKLVGQFMASFSFYSILIYGAFNILIALYYSETQNSLGQKMFANFFLGKYHTPKQERRIFMFLDMKSSTTIAEKMGHNDYYRLLDDYYKTMTYPIVDANGEIYQYVGDEVVITWEESEGIRDNNCINCFRRIKELFLERSSYFMDQYGLVPQFKAGLHTGPVTTGEIGTLKKEIVYSGDVLNTAARIQGLCNDYDADLLISQALFTLINMDDAPYERIGELNLRGREKQIEVVKLYV